MESRAAGNPAESHRHTATLPVPEHYRLTVPRRDPAVPYLRRSPTAPFGGQGGPPFGPPGAPPFGGPPGQGPGPRLNPALIAGVVMVVVIAGGLIVYFGFLNKSTATSISCSGSLSAPAKCSPSTTTTIPAKPVGSTTTTGPVPATSSSVPPTTSAIPGTSVPAPPPTSPSNSGGCQTVTFGASISLTVDCGAGWSVQSSGQETTLGNSQVSTATMDVWVQQEQSATIQTVVQADDQFFEQQISNFTIPNSSINVQTLSGTHFQQGVATPFTGTVSTSQGTEQIAGQIYILFDPSSQVSARIIAFAGSQSAYNSVAQSVLTMTQSMF